MDSKSMEFFTKESEKIKPLFLAGVDFENKGLIEEALEKKSCSICFNPGYEKNEIPDWLAGINVKLVTLMDNNLAPVKPVLDTVGSIEKVMFYPREEVPGKTFEILKELKEKFNCPIFVFFNVNQTQETRAEIVRQLALKFDKIGYDAKEGFANVF